MKPDTLSLSVADACALTGIHTTKLYELIAAGTLDARKCGARTLIIAASLRAYISDLPAADIRMGRPRAAAAEQPAT